MDWELIFWCILGAVCLFFLIGAVIVPSEPKISQEHLTRINNGGRHL